jgi:hypothetical protein
VGSRFDEPNQAISPTGVLKINMRNTIVYEYPYSDKEIKDLYDPVFIEVRIWDLLIATQMQTVQRIVEQYENANYSDVSCELLQRIKRSALKTFNEFDGFYLSTSKRTRNLYEIAHNAFRTRDLLLLLKNKVEQLDILLSGIHSVRQELQGAEIGRQQRNLLERAQENSDREGALRMLLSVISVVTGLSFALSVASSFNLSSAWKWYLMGAFGAVFLIVYLIVRLQHQEIPVASRIEVKAIVYGTAEEIIDRIIKASGRSLREAILFDVMRAAVAVDVKLLGRLVRVRADIATEVAGFEDEANGVLTIEAINRRYYKDDISIKAISDQATVAIERLSGGLIVILRSLDE